MENDIKPGIYMKCKTDKLKNFSNGVVYVVDKVLTRTSWGTTWVDKVKMVGIKGPISPRNFEVITKDIIRDNNLSVILGSEPQLKVSTTPTKIRKIDEVSDKEYQIFEIIINRISRDRNRLSHQKDYSDFDTMTSLITKGDRKFGLKKEDFDCVKDMTISDLMDKFIKTRQTN